MMTNITYHLEILKSKNTRGAVHFWSRIKSSNRKIVWVSEQYTTKQNAEIPLKKLFKILGKRRATLKFIDLT